MNEQKNAELIRQHWENMSNSFGLDLKSTTKTLTIKKLEISALSQAINYILNQKHEIKNILEFGCGNGYNCCVLAKEFNNSYFTGVDFIPKMIESAKCLAENEKCETTKFLVGDILAMDQIDLLPEYDIVFTDRCIINLDTAEKQKEAIYNLVYKIHTGGYLILIENVLQTYGNQNACRKQMNMEERIPASYNLFLDEKMLMNYAEELSLKLLDIHDFGSLHDLFLYVILPSMNGGIIDYDNPLMEAITKFCINTPTLTKNQFGKFGQNRLYLFRKDL